MNGNGRLNSDDHYIHYCGQKSLRRNGVALIVNKKVEMHTWVQFQERQYDLCFQGRLFTMVVIWVYAPTTNAEEAEVDWFCKDLQDLLELTSKIKRCPFHRRGLESKSRKSRNTGINRQVWPWSTKWSKGKTNRVLSREHTGHSKHHLPTTQETILPMDVTRWSILKSDWLYSS